MDIKNNDIERLTALHRELVSASVDVNWPRIQAVLADAISSLPQCEGAAKIVLVALKKVRREPEIMELYQTLSEKSSEALRNWYADKLQRKLDQENSEYQTLIDAEITYNTNKDLAYFDIVHDMLIHWVEIDSWNNIRKSLTYYTQQDNPNRGTLRTMLAVLKQLRHIEEIKEEYYAAAKKLREGSTHKII